MTTPHLGSVAAAGRPAPRRGRVPLVGREAEREQIQSALAAARQGGGGAVFVTGDPGVGTTRLAAEAVDVAAEAHMVAVRGRARALDAHASCRQAPYQPLVEALLSLGRAGLLPGHEALGPYAPALARLLPDARVPGVAASSSLMVAEAVLRLLALVGRGRGCLLVLEDLHEADPATLATVEYLLEHVEREPVVLLLTVGRQACAAAGLAFRARQRGTATTLDLRPLDRAEVRLLVAAEQGVSPEEADPDLVDRAVTDCGGLPFVVREWLHDHSRGVSGAGAPAAPAAVVESVRRRMEGLGPAGVELMRTGAVFGGRFPVAVVQHALGCTHAELSALLHEGVAAALLAPPGAGGAPWYAFRYPLVAGAVLGGVGPGERAGYARRAVRALADLHPALPGAWCGHAAALHERAGDGAEAVRLYGEAGRRALSEGALDRAVDLLARAQELADDASTPEERADVLELLLDAVARSGRLDRLPASATGPTCPDGLGVPALRRAGLHARLAGVADLAGRPSEAQRHLDIARWLLGDAPSDACAALVDVTAAQVELSRRAPERMRTAAELARRGLAAAGRADLPELAGRARLVLARVLLQRDGEAAAGHLARARVLAHTHRIPALAAEAEVGLAALTSRVDGDLTRLEEARQEALHTGAVPLVHEADLLLALEQIHRGDFESVGARIRERIADATRLRLGRSLAELWLAEAVRHAHQGRRDDMEEALEALAPLADAAPGALPMSYGLARAFCALLEERHDVAEREFAHALVYDAENPSSGDFGRYGIVLLLGVLSGRMAWPHHASVVALSAAGTRWNRQFAGMAHAVLLGREGRAAEATAAAADALEAAAPHPVARALCRRLVAQSAYDHGWGAPVDWLREAEDYFHGAGVPAVAGACRVLLRGLGAPVRQRRSGTGSVPPALRRYGITAREFEVARLLADRIRNKDIAARLCISLRTVEKHVSSLLQKTGHPDRGAFAAAACELPGGFAGAGGTAGYGGSGGSSGYGGSGFPGPESSRRARRSAP